MDDRTLLELAAKAAGMNYLIWTPGASPIVPAEHRVGGRYNWCPLADDGDALRLRNALQATIIDEGDQVYVGIVRFPARAIVREQYERDLPGGYASQSSVNAATRRAIVRAAAAIGKEM